MTKVEGNTAEQALGGLNVKPLYCFGFVSVSKVFMLCLVRNIVQLCCELCYVQNMIF